MRLYGYLALFNVIFVATSLSTSKVSGGHDAPDGKYPYQVSLQISNVHVSGGAIINERYVLTSASFFKLNGFQEITVVVGSNSLAIPGQKYKINKTLLYNYDDVLLTEDIALLKVEGKIEFNDFVKPIKIADKDITNETSAIFTGWGDLSFNGPAPIKLQEIELKIIDQAACKNYWLITRANICTMAGAGPCLGDTGSPLMIDGVLIGIASYGSPCGGYEPNVFTRVYSYADWIHKNSRIES